MRDFLRESFEALKASKVQTERTKSSPQTRDTQPPTPEEVKEAMGYDRNDPNVQVRFVSSASAARAVGLRAILDHLMGEKARAARDEVSLDGGVTGTVTGPFVFDEHPDIVSQPEPDEPNEKFNFEEEVDREIEAHGEYRWNAASEEVDEVLGDIYQEVQRAMRKHETFASAHEGSSVIREEFEELWDHVKADTGYTSEARKEAIQLAAMAIRYIVDLGVDEDGD